MSDMMAPLLNAMRQQAMQVQSHQSTVRVGIVSSYDPANYCAKVKIQPEDTETGWLPVTSPWVGNGWGLFAPLSPGDLVDVQFQEGDFNAGFVCGRFYNDSERPLNVPSGEFWLMHKSGSFLKFTNSGDVEVHTARDLIVTAGRDLSATVARNATIAVSGNIVSNAASWTHTGPLTVNGALTGLLGISISGIHPATSVSGQISGNFNFVNSNIVATTTTMTINGKRIDDTLRVSGVQAGGSNSGTPV